MSHRFSRLINVIHIAIIIYLNVYRLFHKQHYVGQIKCPVDLTTKNRQQQSM